MIIHDGQEYWNEPGIFEIPYDYSSSPVKEDDSFRPVYDFDDRYAFVRLIPKDGDQKPDTTQWVYFIFDKMTYETNGPFSAKEFHDQEAVVGKTFTWKMLEITSREASRSVFWLIVMSVLTYAVIFIGIPILVIYFFYKLWVWRATKNC